MRALRWLLFAGLMFLPLMDGGTRLFGTRVLVFDIYLAALIFLAFFTFRHQAKLHLQTGAWMAVFLSMLFVSWLLASLVATHVDAALSGTIRNVKLSIFALILALTISGIHEIRFYIIGLLSAVAWVSLIGWVQSIWGNAAFQIRANTQVNAVHYLGTFGQYGERTVSAFGDPIMSGHFLAVGLCSALGWALSTNNSRERFWLLILTLGALLPLITSASRGPITACFLTGLTLIFYSGIRTRRLFLLICLGILIALYSQDIMRILAGIGLFDVSLARIGYGLESNRWEYWSRIISMAGSYPLGIGLGNFPDVAPRYIPAYLIYINASGWLETNIHAESMYLTQLIELGWLGFVAFVGIVSLSVFSSWRLFLRSNKIQPGAEHCIRASMFGAWVSIALSMITTYGYNNIGIAMLFWFLVGISIVSPYGPRIRITP